MSGIWGKLRQSNSMSQGDIAAAQPMQQRKQQRQILQMMGITQWVRPHAPVIALSDIDDADFVKNSLSIDSTTTPSTASLKDADSEQVINQPLHEQPVNAPIDDFQSVDASLNDGGGYYDDSASDDFDGSDDVDGSDDFTHFDSGAVASTIYHFDSLDTDSSHTDYNEQPAELPTAYQRMPAVSTDANKKWRLLT